MGTGSRKGGAPAARPGMRGGGRPAVRRGRLLVGAVGWTIPADLASRFPGEGSQLERYAARLPAVEINSTFYRPHPVETFVKWGASVPGGFRFSARVPRLVTHFGRLEGPSVLPGFLGSARGLGEKLGPILLQLPPSLAFDAKLAVPFLRELRELFRGEVACEPRHESWFGEEADRALALYHVARVAVDPAVVPAAARPGGWPGLVYYRLHGSPETSSSSYAAEELAALAVRLRAATAGAAVWCVFDNTASGAAAANALDLLALLLRR